MPRRPGMKLDMPSEYTPELEYSVNLGAESGVSTPLLSPSLTALSDSSVSLPENIVDDPPAASPIRTRSWRPVGVEREQKARSTAYDAAGNLKVAARARKADARDCGICEEPAVSPVKTLCCGALFCRQHIDDWIYAPAADGCCPACKARCVLPASRPASPPASPVPRARTPPAHPAEHTLGVARTGPPPGRFASRAARVEQRPFQRLCSVAGRRRGSGTAQAHDGLVRPRAAPQRARGARSVDRCCGPAGRGWG
ncbi:hypothetical protein B0H14DRAFT_1624718 [Mycena olivaceomarginata]|nr:hypothetical protein B0H14DRAFT_1624718 [Mycena olivaceomarginata]